MLKYCLGFIVHKNKILLLNREKEPWTGRWNGIGGKLEALENGFSAMKREGYEETNLSISKIIPKGILTWDNFAVENNGMYVYFLEVNTINEAIYPLKTIEGILDLKEMNWILDANNTGICDNIPQILKESSKEEFFHIHNNWDGYNLLNTHVIKLEEEYIKELIEDGNNFSFSSSGNVVLGDE